MFAQVELYSAELLDFLTRHPRHGFETFVFFGWLVPLAAVAGWLLLRTDRGQPTTVSFWFAVFVAFALGLLVGLVATRRIGSASLWV